MNHSTTLILPWSPSVNHYWTPVARFNPRTRQYYGELVLNSAAREYRDSAGWAILAQRPKRHQWPYRQSVRATLTVHPPDQKRRDLDNICKAVLDVLVSSGVLVDDALVHELHLYHATWCPDGRIEVCIESLEAVTQQDDA